jgi:hypothetical protein
MQALMGLLEGLESILNGGFRGKMDRMDQGRGRLEA